MMNLTIDIMESLILMGIVILVLKMIKVPSKHSSKDQRGLPLMDPNYKKRKEREERNSYKF